MLGSKGDLQFKFCANAKAAHEAREGLTMSRNSARRGWLREKSACKKENSGCLIPVAKPIEPEAAERRPNQNGASKKETEIRTKTWAVASIESEAGKEYIAICEGTEKHFAEREWARHAERHNAWVAAGSAGEAEPAKPKVMVCKRDLHQQQAQAEAKTLAGGAAPRSKESCR